MGLARILQIRTHLLAPFSPTNCGREETFGGPAAKTEESMDRLRELHASSGANDGLRRIAGSWYAGVALGALIGLAVARALR